MSKNVVVLVTDNNYLQHAKSIIGNLRSVGNYTDDVLIIFSEPVHQSVLDDLDNKNIYYYFINNSDIKTFFGKMYIFSEFVKKWENVIYFDADFLIHKDINSLFSQIEETKLVVDFEEFFIYQYFSREDSEVLRELKSWFDISRNGFNTSCIMFNTNIIDSNTLNDLINLKNKYASINIHTLVENGTEQPILCLKFYDFVKQIKNVNYVGRYNNESIASHTCRWSAPWVCHKEYYNNGLKFFEGLK